MLVTTYEYVMRDKAALRKLEWQYIIVDEGHRMKNAQSKFAQTLGTAYTSKRRVLLTGTPLQVRMPNMRHACVACVICMERRRAAPHGHAAAGAAHCHTHASSIYVLRAVARPVADVATTLGSRRGCCVCLSRAAARLGL